MGGTVDNDKAKRVHSTESKVLSPLGNTVVKIYATNLSNK